MGGAVILAVVLVGLCIYSNKPAGYDELWDIIQILVLSYLINYYLINDIKFE